MLEYEEIVQQSNTARTAAKPREKVLKGDKIKKKEKKRKKKKKKRPKVQSKQRKRKAMREHTKHILEDFDSVKLNKNLHHHLANPSDRTEGKDE